MNRKAAALIITAALLTPQARAAVRVAAPKTAPASGAAGLGLAVPALPGVLSPNANLPSLLLLNPALPSAAMPEAAAVRVAAPSVAAAVQTPAVEADLTRLGAEVGRAAGKDGARGGVRTAAALNGFYSGQSRRKTAAPVSASVQGSPRASGLRAAAETPHPAQGALPFPHRKREFANSISAVTDYEPGIPRKALEAYRKLLASYRNYEANLRERTDIAINYPIDGDMDARLIMGMLRGKDKVESEMRKWERRFPGIHYHAQSGVKRALGLAAISLRPPKPLLLGRTRVRWTEGAGSESRRNEFKGTIVSIHETPLTRKTMAVVVLNDGGMREVRIAKSRVLNPETEIEVSWPDQTYVPGNDRDAMSGRFVFGDERRGKIVGSRRHLTDEFYDVLMRMPDGSVRTMEPQLHMRVLGGPGKKD